jgi:heme exporter protein B
VSFLRKVFAIAAKDVLAELRTRETLGGMFVFALLVVLIFNFSFELRVDNVREVVPGALWVTFTFAGMLGINRSFTLEKDQGSLEGMLLAPVDRSAIYLGKTCANVLFMFVVEVVMVPAAAIFFNVPLFSVPLLAVILLGTIGFAAVGTLLSSVSVNTRAREVMLPLLLFPISVPVVIAAVKITASLLDPTTVEDPAIWWQLLIAFDVIFLAVSSLVFEYTVEY